MLIPGGSELSLPQNTGRFKTALTEAVSQKSALIIMLADNPLIPEDVLHTISKYKNVLLIESAAIATEDDVWREAAAMLSDNHLPQMVSNGFDYQVVQMQLVDVVYEDYEIISKYL
ncbi:hypothetical protein SAMN05444144_10654 [Flavobacterium akiainvivens]|nr:hypothetical protein SAMN05444144_10654 [Flavobacterium akiainvivens]